MAELSMSTKLHEIHIKIYIYAMILKDLDKNANFSHIS